MTDARVAEEGRPRLFWLPAVAFALTIAPMLGVVVTTFLSIGVGLVVAALIGAVATYAFARYWEAGPSQARLFAALAAIVSAAAQLAIWSSVD